MHGTPFFIVAEIAIPSAKQCFLVASPFIAIFAVTFLLRGLNGFLNYLFSNWQVDHEMGWLNLTAQRRAEAVLRWLGYFVYAILAVTLLGITWSAQGLAVTIQHWDDVNVLSDLLVRIPVLLGCLAFWGLYLGLDLYPRLRNQYEEEELEKFRIEQAELAGEEEPNPSSRAKTPLRKHGVNPRLAPNRLKPRR